MVGGKCWRVADNIPTAGMVGDIRSEYGRVRVLIVGTTKLRGVP